MASDKEGRRLSSGGKCLFKGRGRATLTVFGYNYWKDFLKCNERDLTSEEIAEVEKAADYENFSVEGVARVEWPDVTLDFRMDRFIGGRRRRTPLVFTATQDFATVMHPFAVNKTWYKGFDSHDSKRIDGYDWVFHQNHENFTYFGHVKKGKEIFVTFEFAPNNIYHEIDS